MHLQQFLVSMGETDLPHGGGGLALFEPQFAGVQLQMAATEGDGAGGHQDHLLPPLAQACDVGGKAFEPRAVQTSLVDIHQQRRSHLHHDPPGICEAARSGFAISEGHGVQYCHLLGRAASPNIRVHEQRNDQQRAT